MLDSIIGRPSCRAKCLPTNLALVATTLPPCCLVEAMANDGCGAAIFRGRAVPVGTAEVDFLEARTDGLKLSLKLYHAGHLQLDYQQLMAEAPPSPGKCRVTLRRSAQATRLQRFHDIDGRRDSALFSVLYRALRNCRSLSPGRNRASLTFSGVVLASACSFIASVASR